MRNLRKYEGLPFDFEESRVNIEQDRKSLKSISTKNESDKRRSSGHHHNAFQN